MTQPTPISEKDLVDRVSSVMRPEFPHWVLFKLGTYVVLDAEHEQLDPVANAVRRLKKFGPVYPGSPAGDFSIITLPGEGWVVSGHGHGIYTYVDRSELSGSAGSDFEVGLLGRAKRGRDAELLQVIYVNGANA